MILILRFQTLVHLKRFDINFEPEFEINTRACTHLTEFAHMDAWACMNRLAFQAESKGIECFTHFSKKKKEKKLIVFVDLSMMLSLIYKFHFNSCAEEINRSGWATSTIDKIPKIESNFYFWLTYVHVMHVLCWS